MQLSLSHPYVTGYTFYTPLTRQLQFSIHRFEAIELQYLPCSDSRRTDGTKVRRGRRCLYIILRSLDARDVHVNYNS